MKREPYRSGPVVWVAILTTTCLLLFLFQKILWLVVPFLLALMAYYLLYPAQQRLVLFGLSRDLSSVLVSGGCVAVVAVALMFLFPWFSAHFVFWQDYASRYLEGGLRFLAETLAWAERNYAFAAKAQLSDQLSRQIALLSERVAGAYLGEAVLAAAAWFPSLLLAPFLAFFFLRDGWRFKMFLSRAVPNAFFERTLYLLDQVDCTARLYFQGLLKLTVLDALCLAFGLALIGVGSPFALGLATAVLAWIPYVGSILGCLIVVLVVATDFPGDPAMAYAAIGLFVWVRLLDDFFFMQITIGRSLKLHPLVTVVMIFVGGAVAGVSGLMLVLPLLGVVMVLGATVGEIVTDPRLRARHAFAKRLVQRQATTDLYL